MGLITDAKDMLAAATILFESGERAATRPTYYLLGHSIELALKSFLLANGDSLDRLKFRIGHDLSKAARRVVAAKCDPLSSIVEENRDLIAALNYYYEEKEFEYRVTGLKQYPRKELLFEFLQAAIPLIEPIAFQAYKDRRA